MNLNAIVQIVHFNRLLGNEIFYWVCVILSSMLFLISYYLHMEASIAKWDYSLKQLVEKFK